MRPSVTNNLLTIYINLPIMGPNFHPKANCIFGSSFIHLLPASGGCQAFRPSGSEECCPDAGRFATKAEEILVTFVQNLPEAPVRWRPAPLDPEQVEEDDLERPCPQQAGLLASPSCLSCLLGRFGGCKRKALYWGR